MANNGNVVNVNKLMHQYAVLWKNLKGERYKVSPSAVHEYSVRVSERIVDYMPELCHIAMRHGRKTVMEEDVIELFGIIGRDVV